MLSLSSISKAALLGLCLAWIPGTPLRAASLEGRKIARIEVKSPDTASVRSLEDFFRSEIGPTFSSVRITEAIKKVYAGRFLYQIKAYGVETGDSVVVRIEVSPRPTIEAIVFSGNHSVGTLDLEERLGLTAGDPVSPETLEECRKSLNEYYVFRGFTSSKVMVRSLQSEGAKVKISVDVEEGVPCRIESVDLKLAKPVVSRERAMGFLEISVGDRCDGEAIRQGVRRLEQKLRDEGRLAALFQEPVVEYSQDRTGAKVTVEVNPGPPIHVVLQGNTYAFERNAVLEKAMALRDEKRFGRGWTEGTAKEGIQSFYRGQGYPDVKVEVEDVSREGSDERTITFKVDRGKKMWLDHVSFKGNRALEEDSLRSAFFDTAADSLQDGDFVQSDLDTGVTGVLSLYQSKGYLRAEVSQPQIRLDAKRREADVAFEVREGEPTILSEYRIRGNRLFDNAAIIEWMKASPGQPLDPVVMEKAAEGIGERYHSKGYKFASVSVPKVTELPAGPVTYDVTVVEGRVVEFGEVSIRGNLHTDEEVIRRVLKIKEGDKYSPDALRETRRRISQLGFFTQIAIEEVNYDPSTGREDVVITVEERKKRSVRLRPGYSTEKGPQLEADLGYINIGGTGRSATVYSEVSRRVPDADITAYKVIGTYLEPFFLNLATGRINVIQERQEERLYNIDRTSLILGLDREWARWLRSTLQWELEFRKPFDVQTGVLQSPSSPFDEEPARFGSISTILDFDFRDNILNPIKGSFHRLRFDLYDKSLGSQAEFWQVLFRNTFYVPIYRRIRVVTAVRVGFSATYGDTSSQGIDDLPIEKRFRLGGASSLRGFSRNCVGAVPSGLPEDCSNMALDVAPGGNAMFNYQTDLLLPIASNFDIALFTDGGEAFLLNSNFDPIKIRTSAGVGLRYNGFFGTVRLDVGFKLARRTGEGLTGVTFSIGQF